MDSFDIMNQCDSMLPPGDVYRKAFDTALMGMESKGGGGGGGGSSGPDWDEIADLQHEQAMNSYNYDCDNTQRGYNHQILQNEIQRRDQAQQHAYQTATQQQQWMYANAIKEQEYNAQVAAYNKSERMYEHQLQMNSIAADMAMDAQNAQTEERYQALLFSEQRSFLDYTTKKTEGALQRMGADLDIYSKRLRAERDKKDLTIKERTKRGVSAFRSQEELVKGMQALGQAKSRGQSGRSAEKQYQSIVAGLGRLQAARAYELNRSDLAYRLAMQGVDQTLNEQEAAHLLTEGKLDLDRLALEAGYEVTQAEEDATALSIKGAHERAGKKIIHDKYAADVGADFNRMSAPSRGVPIPKPLEIPMATIMDPLVPVRGKPPVWGAGVGAGPSSAGSTGGGMGPFTMAGGAIGGALMMSTAVATGGLGLPIGLAVGGLMDALF